MQHYRTIPPEKGAMSRADVSAASPSLRLTAAVNTSDPQESSAAMLTEATDPRWVLAVRTAEQLQGTILPPQQRYKLIRLGKLIGLTAFDANLVIAIVQDRARRGYPAAQCPAAAHDQLAMLAPPHSRAADRLRRAWAIAGAVTAVIVIEIVLILTLI
jgi:hypothetical protein